MSDSNKKLFAQKIAAGLGGWFQQLAALGLASEVGEDAAKLELIRMAGGIRSYVAKASQRPTNWPVAEKRRIDVAVLGRSADAAGWYGAIELKWAKKSSDASQIRQAIVEDAVRVAFSKTANLNANFIVLGGEISAMEKLFDKQHNAAQAKEDQRIHFCQLFSRSNQNVNGSLSNMLLKQHFPTFCERTPEEVIGNWSRRLGTELIASVPCMVGSNTHGHVYVWQCSK
jgi:hypothetical protein